MWSSTSTASFLLIISLAILYCPPCGSSSNFGAWQLKALQDDLKCVAWHCSDCSGHCAIQYIHSPASGVLPATCSIHDRYAWRKHGKMICWNPVRTFNASAPGVHPMLVISGHAKLATRWCSSWQCALMPCKKKNYVLVLPWARVLLPHIRFWSATSLRFLEHLGWKNCDTRASEGGHSMCFQRSQHGRITSENQPSEFLNLYI